MKKVIFFWMAVLVSGTLLAQPAQTYIGEKIKVTFPGTPDSNVNQMGAKALTYKKDPTKAFGTVAIDLAPLGLSADMVSSMGDGLWEQMKSPMLAQMGSVDLIKDELVQFKGKSCLKMELDISKVNTPEMKGKKMYMLNFFVGSVLYQLNVIAIASDNMKDDAEAFFNTLTIE